MCARERGNKLLPVVLLGLTGLLLILVGLTASLKAEGIAPHSFPLFAVSRTDGKVFKIDSTGDLALFASGLSTPGPIAWSPSGQLLVGQENGQIIRLDGGGVQHPFATINGPVRGIAFDTSGNVFAGNESGGQIIKLSPDGQQQSVFASGLGCAEDLAFDSSGDLFATTGGYGDNKIVRITPDGILHDFATVGLNPTCLSFDWTGFPSGYLISNENDAGQFALSKIDSGGNVVPGSRVGFPGFVVCDMVAAADGYIYAMQGSNVLKLDSDLNLVGTIATGGDYGWGITATPEPATLSLLALGGLALLRRKRGYGG